MCGQTKHLGLLESTANSALSTASATYTTAKESTISTSVSFVEGIFSHLEWLGSPLVAFGQSRAIKVLLLADSTVDTSLSAVAYTAKLSRTSASKVVGEERVSRVESVTTDAIAAVTDKVKTLCGERIPAGVRATKGAAASAIRGVQSRAAAVRNDVHGLATATYGGVQSRAAAARDGIYDLATATYGGVQSRVVAPLGGFAFNKYTHARETITSQPLYARSYHLAANTIAYGADTRAARTAANVYARTLQPLFSPIVDKSAPYLRAALRELQPTASAEKIIRRKNGAEHVNGAIDANNETPASPREDTRATSRAGKPVRRKAAGSKAARGPSKAAAASQE